MYETLDAALEALGVAFLDVAGDMGSEAAEECAYDLVVSICYECTPEVARELCRTQLGFIPDALSFTSPR